MSSTDYVALGLSSVISAGGYFSNLGGSLMSEEVIDAMNEAAKNFVEMKELQLKAGERIARIMGTEDALITSGAAAGDVLAVASFLVGSDKWIAKQLPNTENLAKNEIIVQRTHIVAYEQSVRSTGAKICEIGSMSFTQPWELEGAINSKTAGMFNSASSEVIHRAELPYELVVEITKRKGVPTVIDAADTLPPHTNLTKWTRLGFDLVVFSGGKAIGGPNDSGIVAGRKDLIESCRMQNAPNEFIGRPFKVSKEQIVGLLVALESYSKRDHAAQMKAWKSKQAYLLSELADMPNTKVFPTRDERGTRIRIVLNEKAAGKTAVEIVRKLRTEEPKIAVDNFREKIGVIQLDVVALREGEEKIVCERLKELLSSRT